MSNYERINSERNIFLTKIFEPEENSLEFELTMGIVGELEKSHKILGVDIGPSRPVYHNENSEIFKITFDRYIAYSVINESYERQQCITAITADSTTSESTRNCERQC
jgi:hypothetical protein